MYIGNKGKIMMVASKLKLTVILVSLIAILFCAWAKDMCTQFKLPVYWFKLIYLALKNIAKKWTMPIRDWKSALNQFSIMYGERLPNF